MMKIKTEDLINSIFDGLEELTYIHLDEFPNINLYMDQLTTFMEDRLTSTKRYDEDKVLTKTMINNYAKNDLLPPPIKKQYSTEHMLTLTFIYYFKSLLSITDIQKVLTPIHDKYFSSSDYSIRDIYKEVFSMEEDAKEHLKEELAKNYQDSLTLFEDAPEEDQEFLKQFAFICQLCFDIYVRKLILEKMIDEFPDPTKKKKKD